MGVLYVQDENGNFVEVPFLRGRSAYNIAVANGFEGTEAEWLDSLKPKKGTDYFDGYTPVKGTDYWTEADKAEIDRTGTLACVLEGLLGMSQSDIDKDYELTCFYFGTATDSEARRRNESDWQGLINAINAKDGSTFRDKCVTFVAELGFTADEINAYRAAMIDGTPETVTPNIGTYAVSMTLGSGITADNKATTIDQYQPYKVNIDCDEGRVISSVKVTMGGTDITSKVWRGSKTSKNGL